MTFEEILDQAVAMLQRRGRVTYRALQAQFQLDDNLLETLKEEILYSQPQVVDDEGKGLMWTGTLATTPERTSVSSAQREVMQHDQPVQVEPPLAEPRLTEAERRQLTVMFCDLVDSTKLSSQLDPEDYRDVVREYQRVCSEVIARYDGHIAQYLGDGLLIYFGYPVAHEEDAQRAIHTGLGIVEAIGNLNTRLEQTKSIRLAVRLGIHTGLVVVGEMGGEGRQEQLALGETPNIAARIQGLAEPDTVVISDATYRLIQGYFDCQALGEQTLRGVSQPIAVYRVLRESGVQSRLDVASTRGLTPLVGREQEVGLLLERWDQVKDGQGQVILLSGEAGIGKSRLVQVLKDQVASEPHTRWECRSSPYYQNTALYPLIDLLQRALQWRQDDPPDKRLEKLEHLLDQYRLPLEETIPLFASLLSLSLPEDRYPLLNFSPQRQRQKTLEAILAIILELAERQPMLLILEDLHWTDPTTLEFLSLLVEQVPTTSLCALLTCRPHFQPAWHHRSYLTEITVNRLSREQIERVAQYVAGGKMLPVAIVQQLVDKTDGVPLYVEELSKVVLESGTLKDVNGQYEIVGSFTSLAIPATLQDSLMARLDRLVSAKGIAQMGATIGRQFSYALLQSVSQLDETTLQRELGRLVEAELVYQRGLPPHVTYTFKHALIQDTAYESLLRSTRQQYHQRIAQVLEAQFPETAEAQPELLAHHCTEAGLIEQAVRYWQHAGQRAVEYSAYVEAIAHLTTGVELLKTLPDTWERAQHELTLQITLGTALAAARNYGASEVGQAFSRAQELCQRVGDRPQLFAVLLGLRRFYFVRGDLQTAHELEQQMLTLAQNMQASPLLLEAHRTLGATLYSLGAFDAARTQLEQGLALYDPQQHRSLALLHGTDPGVVCGTWASLVLWSVGFPDQALTRSHEACALAQAVAHPVSLGMALALTPMLHQFRRENRVAQEKAETVIALAMAHGFTFREAQGRIVWGWALATQGAGEEGIVQIRQGLADLQGTEAGGFVPYYLSLLAEAYACTGQTEAGLRALAEAQALVDTTGERMWEVELHRLKGELLLSLSPDHQTEAETCFHQALDVARTQQAKSLELRVATSLARLWQSQNKRQDAYDLLAPVYDWFTEGFDTADLQDAKALLDDLS